MNQRHERAVRRIAVASVVIMAILSTAEKGRSQEAPAQEDPWQLLRTLEGTWAASISGRLGTGEGIRAYEFIMDRRFLQLTHESVRLPQPQSPSGDHHRELGVFSYDTTRGTIVYRQFIVEGFVLRYACEADETERRLVCLSESVENGEGLRARETIELTSDHTFEETFELADPGEDFKVLFTNHWRRKPNLN